MIVEKAVVVLLMNLASGMSGYQPLPDELIPDVTFVTQAELIRLSCQDVPEVSRPICENHDSTKKSAAAYDRVRNHVYVTERYQARYERGSTHVRGIIVHELVHALQRHWKRNDNPDLTRKEYEEDEAEAYRVQYRLCAEGCW